MRVKTRRGVLGILAAALALAGAVAIPAAPAQAAWGGRVSVDMRITDYGPSGTQHVGRAYGWVQINDATDTFRFSLTFCRQNSYMDPYMKVSVNKYVGDSGYLIDTVYPSSWANSSGSCVMKATASGQYTSHGEYGYGLSNVYLQIFGSTFHGGTYVIDSQDALIW